jgi:AraC-like DNA-binding protein
MFGEYLIYHLILSFYFLLVGVLLLRNEKKILAWKTLGVLYLIIAIIFNLVYFLNYPRIFGNAHLFRTVSPLFYLIAPLSYLFQTFLLNPERKVTKLDLLHFVPFLVHFLEYVPFYLSSYDQKIAEINYVFSTKDYFQSFGNWGLIDLSLHYKFKFILNNAYVIASLIQLSRFCTNHTKEFCHQHRLAISVLFSFLYINFISQNLSVYYQGSENLNLDYLPSDYLFFLVFILASGALFFKDSVFKLFDFSPIEKPQCIEKPIKKIYDDINLRKKLEHYFDLNKSFLNNSLTVIDVIQALKIKPHLLRSFIKEEYNLSLIDYINLKRIEYAKEQFENNLGWKQYSLEGIATSSGFASRYGFINSIKKLKNLTPREYFKGKKIGQIEDFNKSETLELSCN